MENKSKRDTRNEMSVNITLDGRMLGDPIRLDLTDDQTTQQVVLYDAINKALKEANALASIQPENIPNNLIYVGTNKENGKFMYMHKENQKIYIIEEQPILYDQVASFVNSVGNGEFDSIKYKHGVGFTSTKGEEKNIKKSEYPFENI